MATLIIPRGTNIDILSGVSTPFSFFDRWKEETDKPNIKCITSSFVESLFSFLQTRNCNIVNKGGITDFLNNHIGIIDYLYEVPNVIRGKFGEVNLNLELFFDSEIEDNEGELFLNIETDFDAQKAHEKLEEIDKEWFIPVVGENITKFNLSLDFI